MFCLEMFCECKSQITAQLSENECQLFYSEYKSFEHYFNISVVFSFVSTRRIQQPSGAEQVLRVFVLIASRLMSAHHMMVHDLHAGNASLPKAVIAPARSTPCFKKKTPTHIIGCKLRSSFLILIIFDTNIPHKI